MKIFTVIGARPQFIKAAVVSRALKYNRPDITEVLVHTGQHYDANMSDVFFDELNIPKPKHNLGIGGGTHAQNTGRMLERLESLMMEEKPDFVMVYGDTDSTLSGALAAAKLHIAVAHVEAGLRSFNRQMPEEINRVLTDHISSLLFAPSELALTNLRNEGVVTNSIHVVGDVMYDAALFYKSHSRKPHWFDALELEVDGFVLCTIHRAENTDHEARMRGILQGLGRCNRPVVLPLHPRTRSKLGGMQLLVPSNVKIVDPVGYLEMVWLESNCSIVATDSGGVQKEAYFHGKRCVTLRDETEWQELVDCGANKLAGANPEIIASELCNIDPLSVDSRLYGAGDSGVIISRLLR